MAIISLLVFRKVLSTKVIKLANVRASLLSVWSLRKGVSIRNMGDNLLAFQFFFTKWIREKFWMGSQGM